MGESCLPEQEVATLRRKGEESSIHQIVQRLGDGQRLARLDGYSRALQRPNDLERVERIAAGCLVHLGEERAWERRAEVAMDHAVKGLHVERGDVDDDHPLGRKRAPELGEQGALQGRTARQ